jgi:hypothetical protein
LDALEKEWDTGRRSISEIAPCTRWQDFCGNTEIPDDLKEREPQRAALYKATAALVRAFANIAGELEAAGYTQPKIGRIKQAIDRHVKLREIIRNASGESLDRHAGAPRPLQQPQPRPGLGPEGRRSDQAKPPRQLARRPGSRDGHQKGLVRCASRRGPGGAHLPDRQAAVGILMVAKIDLGGIPVEVIKKHIKNVHLSVYPPTGKVRISAPLRMSLDTIRVFAISKLGWMGLDLGG